MTVTVDDRLLDHSDALADLIADVRTGFAQTPKTLPPRWFYDAVGSELFERITELPEYYPTRSERQILVDHAAEIAALAPVSTVVELGSGSSTKTLLLLDAWHRGGSLKHLVTVDVSTSALVEAAGPLSRRYPDIDLSPVRADFTQHLAELPAGGSTALVFLGSTIGNLDPAQRAEFLSDARRLLSGDDDVLVLGADLVKPAAVLVPAYDDAAGVTAAFNANLITVLNRELDGDLPPEAFRHEAVWNDAEERIEMWLRATRAVRAHLTRAGLDVELAAGEGIRTEISSKFRPERLDAELTAAGFRAERRWTDRDELFSLTVAR